MDWLTRKYRQVEKHISIFFFFLTTMTNLRIVNMIFKINSIHLRTYLGDLVMYF